MAPPSRPPQGSDALTKMLKTDVEAELTLKFGLLVERIDLEPGEDKLIDCMKALTRLQIPFTIPATDPLVFERGDVAPRITMEAIGSIFIVSIDGEPNNWPSFYNNVARSPDTKTWIDQIKGILLQTLQLTQGEVSRADLGALDADRVKAFVVARFTKEVRKVVGLLAQIDNLVLRIHRPESRDTFSLVIADLHKELSLVSSLRAQASEAGSTYGGTDRRATLTTRMKEIREEIEAEAALQRQVAARTETISIEQDRDTGLLLDTDGTP